MLKQDWYKKPSFDLSYLTYSEVSLIMCSESGLMAVGSLSSASDRAISFPVLRFLTLICLRSSCEKKIEIREVENSHNQLQH